MSETKWIPYDEDKDKRPLRASRPLVKITTVYRNYSLYQFMLVICVALIAFGGYFYAKQDILLSPFIQYPFYQSILSFVMAIIIIFLSEDMKENQEVLLEDLS